MVKRTHMASAASDRESAPEITLTQVTAGRDEPLRSWNIGWRVRNVGRYAIRILSVHLPHSQFKSEERLFEPAMDLNAGDEDHVWTSVRCEEPPGLVTENAFVIFCVSWLDDPWRIFVRLRVVVNSDGKPETGTELITTQKVGFSGVAS